MVPIEYETVSTEVKADMDKEFNMEENVGYGTNQDFTTPHQPSRDCVYEIIA